MYTIIPQITLSEVEQEVIIERFSDPLVVKYLEMLAAGLASDILGAVPAPQESDSAFIRSQQAHRGALDMLNTLLSIKDSSNV